MELDVTAADGKPRRATIVLDDLNDFIQKRIHETQDFYERPLLDYLASAFGGREVAFVDVGANIGNHSVFMGATLGARLLCIEPRHETFARLQRNLEASGLTSQATCVHAAVGSEEATGVSVITEQGNLGACEVVIRKAQEGELEVRVHALDDIAEPFLAGHEGPIVVKIDVEGMESQVVAGMSRILRRYRPTIVVECVSDSGFVSLSRHLRRLDYGVATMFFKSATFVCAPASELATLQRHALAHSWTLGRQYIEYCALHHTLRQARVHVEKLSGLLERSSNKR